MSTSISEARYGHTELASVSWPVASKAVDACIAYTVTGIVLLVLGKGPLQALPFP